MLLLMTTIAALNCGTHWRSSTQWQQKEAIVFKGGMLGVAASVCVKLDEDDLHASVRLSHILRTSEVYGEARVLRDGELVVERVFSSYLRRRLVTLRAIQPEPDGSAIVVVAAVPMLGDCRVVLLRQA